MKEKHFDIQDMSDDEIEIINGGLGWVVPVITGTWAAYNIANSAYKFYRSYNDGVRQGIL